MDSGSSGNIIPEMDEKPLNLTITTNSSSSHGETTIQLQNNQSAQSAEVRISGENTMTDNTSTNLPTKKSKNKQVKDESAMNLEKETSLDSNNGQEQSHTLRKGKWTLEEEMYTNKVIEVFNLGILKLHGHEKGVTLRAYLANKLGCDPMRITKKFTGNASIGKRVYHAETSALDEEDVRQAQEELEILELNFKQKLERSSWVKPSSDFGVRPNISTAAIEQLVSQGRAISWSNLMNTTSQQGIDGTLTKPSYTSRDPITTNPNNSIKPEQSEFSVSMLSLEESSNNKDNRNSRDDDVLSKKIKLSESDQSLAANSLLGFFEHLQKRNSHEDLVEFFEDVQKNASSSISRSLTPSTSTNSLFQSLKKSASTGQLRVSNSSNIIGANSGDESFDVESRNNHNDNENNMHTKGSGPYYF